MARWIALGITLICFGSCSFMSQNVFRGMIAPVGAIVFAVISLLLFIHARVGEAARPHSAAVLDPEVQRLMRERAAKRQTDQQRETSASAGQLPGNRS